jgi:hypothetical protein
MKRRDIAWILILMQDSSHGARRLLHCSTT